MAAPATTAPRDDSRARPLAPRLKRASRSFLLTLVATCAVAAFLEPLLQAVSLSVKSSAQISERGAPLWPADPVVFEYEGRTYDVYVVPVEVAHEAWPWFNRVG